MTKPYEPRAISDTRVGSNLLTNNTTLNMALASEGKDDKSSSSWLSLDSSTADNPVLSNAMLQKGTTGEDPASRSFTIGKAVMGERHTIDVVQQPSLGPHVFTTPRKLRKRDGKLNANLDIGLSVEKSSHDGNREDG